jgi:GntR family transcriptional regulator / MocR family aminotransferase
MSPRNLQARDVLLRVDRSRSAVPVSQQLEEQMRSAIQSGSLAAGEQLPSTRVLAEDLGVSRGLILRVYGQLAAAGYICTRQGAAPTVRATVRFDPQTTRAPHGRPKVVYDLRPHLPEVASFPRRSWLRAVRESLEHARTADLTYSDGAGLWELRVAVANYLSRARGVRAHPEQILITAGSTHALSLVSRLLARQGKTRMAFENPSHHVLRSAAVMGGQTVVAAAVDERGVRPDTIERADSVFVCPAHQFPTGVVLAPERRRALVDWAQEFDALIVEDDYDAEFRYDRAPTGALQDLAPERIIYVGSTGKTFAPALRLGWMVLPDDLVSEMSQELTSNMLQVSGLNQLAFANFLQRGDFDRHLRHMRGVYQARRDLVASLLAELLPDHEVRGIAAGLHVVLGMPSRLAAASVRTEAQALGIVVESIDQHSFAQDRGPAALLVGYGALPEPTLERALTSLAEIIRRRAELMRPDDRQGRTSTNHEARE